MGVHYLLFSGADGRFMLSPLPTGRYRVYAWNETSGVPNPRMLLFQHSNPHSYEITVRANETVHAGNIALPRPYGRVTLRVVDSKTKLPIGLARCTLRRTDVTNVMYATDSTNGEFSFLLPDNPISLKVTSSGYEDWSYLEPSDARAYLLLESGKQLTILVSLEARP